MVVEGWCPRDSDKVTALGSIPRATTDLLSWRLHQMVVVGSLPRHELIHVPRIEYTVGRLNPTVPYSTKPLASSYCSLVLARLVVRTKEVPSNRSTMMPK